MARGCGRAFGFSSPLPRSVVADLKAVGWFGKPTPVAACGASLKGTGYRQPGRRVCSPPQWGLQWLGQLESISVPRTR